MIRALFMYDLSLLSSFNANILFMTTCGSGSLSINSNFTVRLLSITVIGDKCANFKTPIAAVFRTYAFLSVIPRNKGETIYSKTEGILRESNALKANPRINGSSFLQSLSSVFITKTTSSSLD